MHEKKEETYIVKNKESDFMKRILKNIVSVLLLLCLAFSIVGCGEENPLEKGELYTLEEVYEEGGIGRTALLNIAYYSGNSEYNSAEIGQDFVPIEKGELSEEISLEIAEYLNERARTKETRSRYTDYRVIKYYGCYNGYYAVVFSDMAADTPYVWNEFWTEIDGVAFYSSGYSREEIHMWKRR